MIIGRRYDIKRHSNVAFFIRDCLVLDYDKNLDTVLIERESNWNGRVKEIIQMGDDRYTATLISEYKYGDYILIKCKNKKDWSYTNSYYIFVSEDGVTLSFKESFDSRVMKTDLACVTFTKVPESMLKILGK